MGTDDIFKRKRQQRRARRAEWLDPKPDSYLIVCEGSKTEPLYFNELAEFIRIELEGRVDVPKIPTIEVSGEGEGTVALVHKAIEIRNRANFVYQHVWVVFDKDDFKDFDEAISLARENAIEVAWSNPCFEFWILLHFEYVDAALDRHQVFEKVDSLFKERCVRAEGYEKNLSNLYSLLSVCGQQSQAAHWAERLLGRYDDGQPCSSRVPATTVHKLVRELEDLRRRSVR